MEKKINMIRIKFQLPINTSHSHPRNNGLVIKLQFDTKPKGSEIILSLDSWEISTGLSP